MPAKPARARRPRGAAESLASIVLTFEAVIAFLGGLAIFGLDALPESVPQWWGVVGGVAVALLMLLTAGLVRYRWGIAVGWLLQLIVALGAFLVPALLFVAIIFGGMYAYATIKGSSLDRINAKRAASPTEPA
ncbi:DUF4233 domain-containing protein [Microbacterium sp. R86528]|uniref:DUF4233 domain-containing protein n=1 Tax=Microbacterium sp. R86528 TaxID=3093864 RepID=UPI0037C7F777